MEKTEIFISSAEEEMAYERETVAEVVSSMQWHPVRFEASPIRGTTPRSQYLKRVENCEIFVLLLSKSLREAVVEEYEVAVRNHKPIMILLKKVTDPKTREPLMLEFLGRIREGVQAGSRQGTWREFLTLKDLREEFKQNLMAETSALFRPPGLSSDREQLYKIGSGIIEHAQKRLLINQPRPTLLLGPKNRNRAHQGMVASPPINYELEFLTELEKWIEKYKSIADVRFTYLYDEKMAAESAAKEIGASIDGAKQKEIIERIERYKLIEQATNGRFVFAPMRMEASGPFCIGDNRYALWILGDEKYAICFEKEDPKTADTLARTIVQQNDQRITAGEMIQRILDPSIGKSPLIAPATKKGYRD